MIETCEKNIQNLKNEMFKKKCLISNVKKDERNDEKNLK